MEKSKPAPKANVSKEAVAAAKASKVSKETFDVSRRLSDAERQIACLRARGIVLWSVE